MEHPVITSIKIAGDKGIIIPSSGTNSSTYTALAREQYGHEMQGVDFTWSVDAYETEGVSIDGATVSVSSKAAEQTVIVKAVSF